MDTQVITPEFRVSWPNVFTPRKNDLNGKDEYSIMALFPAGADLSLMEKAAEAARIAKWGADKKKWPKNMRSPFREQSKIKNKNGDVVLPAGQVEGAIFVNMKGKEQPGLVDQKRQSIINESDFYAGCYARAQVNAYAYDMKGNCGVSFGLNAIQKTRDGEQLSGRRRAEDIFTEIDGGQSGTADDIFAS